MSKTETPSTSPEKAALEVAFTYHAPGGTQPPRFEAVRDAGKKLAETILDQVPDCPERQQAWDKVQEAVMWANAGIAREQARRQRPQRTAA